MDASILLYQLPNAESNQLEHDAALNSKNNNGMHQRSPAVRMQRSVSILSLRASPGQSEVICGASSYPERHPPPPPQNAAPKEAYTWRRYAAGKPIPALSGVVFDIRVPSVVSHLWNGGFAVTCRRVPENPAKIQRHATVRQIRAGEEEGGGGRRGGG